ncbi:2-aminobenzoate-CoA ligase [Streptomyces umbrinus]|uniref:AMP-binding protein n=1 Tax=Streptomyces umbrinus TaxID=67370 RepID=UPI00167D8CEF|nr:AMP-binding protein [Streptomyces umbrinus]MCR3723732.1 2-aminobenzoate-CoA ligase [Streptomyces umbrinus]GHH42807.1 acetyl-CoA synthetase [Streptomyces umbrinus]
MTPPSPLPISAISAHLDTFTRDHLPPAHLLPTIEFSTPELRYPERLNAAAELIDIPVSTFGADRPALRTPAGETWSYGELRTRANQVAQVLTEDLGLVPGQRVLLRSPNNPWAVASWLGVLKAGGVVVTVMAALRAREIAPIVERTRPSVALVDRRFAEDVHAVRETQDANAEQDAASPALTVVEFGGTGPDDLVARVGTKSGEFTAVDTAADDVALLAPTSGSTGVPKITMHFHRDILSIDNTFGRHVLRLLPDDLVACSAPFAFTFGLGMLVVFPLRAGACALLTEAATPLQLAQYVDELGVTVLATAPTAYQAILREGQEQRLAGLRVGVSAGEHIPKAVWERLRDRLGLRIVDGIGATELLHIFLSAAGDDIRPGATGKPVPGYRATILGPDDSELGPGEPGRLGVIGPVGCRYLDDERQKDYVVEGWNVTGDVFHRDEDGYFHYHARGDSMIVSSGYNIGGPEVEAAVDTHPDVLESAVVGKPDAQRGFVVCAFVVLREGVPGDAAKAREIQDHVKEVIAPYKYPRDVRFCDALPRNASGKLQRFALRRIVEDEQATKAAVEQ